MKRLRTQQQQRRLQERQLKELRRLAKQIAHRDREDIKDILYDLTGEWEPVKSHEWDEF